MTPIGVMIMITTRIVTERIFVQHFRLAPRVESGLSCALLLSNELAFAVGGGSLAPALAKGETVEAGGCERVLFHLVGSVSMAAKFTHVI